MSKYIRQPTKQRIAIIKADFIHILSGGAALNKDTPGGVMHPVAIDTIDTLFEDIFMLGYNYRARSS